MAIEFFKREEPEVKFLAVEKLNLIYNLITTLLVIVFFNRLNDPQSMFLGRFVIAVATFAVIFLYTKLPSKATRFLRIVLQVALLSYWYPDTFEFNRIFPNLDHLFAAMDLNLFGCQPSLLFDQVCSGILWREAFNMGYWLYYPMIVTVALFYFFRRPSEVERCTFVIMASFFIYYLIYIFLPVAGPQFYFPAIGMDNVVTENFLSIGDYFNHNAILLPGPDTHQGFFYSLVEASQEVGERPTAAFPSSHVGISTICMIMAWRVNRKLRYLMAPFYVLLCCATVYIQAHYLIDVFAGWLSAVCIYLISTWMYKRWFASSVFRSVLG